MLADDSGIRPRVVKFELYERSPPPGNNGGAVSGAAPCPFADGTQSSAKDTNTHFLILKVTSNQNVTSTRMRQPGSRLEV